MGNMKRIEVQDHRRLYDAGKAATLERGSDMSPQYFTEVSFAFEAELRECFPAPDFSVIVEYDREIETQTEKVIPICVSGEKNFCVSDTQDPSTGQNFSEDGREYPYYSTPEKAIAVTKEVYGKKFNVEKMELRLQETTGGENVDLTGKASIFDHRIF